MATRMNTKASSRNDNDAAKFSPIDSSEKSKTAAAKSTTSRQTSLRNFFGTAEKSKRTVSFQQQQNDQAKTSSKFCPLTPPTPVSPQSIPTPPTEQDAYATAKTPPSPENVAVVFKKAKRETSQEKNTNGSSVSTTNVPPSSRSVAAKERKGKKALEQTYLDLGQIDFGKRTICKTCGMLYVHGLNEDSKQHSRICMDYMKGVPFTVPQARTVATDPMGFIVEVRHSDSYTLRSKVKRVKEIVDRDLGFAPSDAPIPQARTTFLYISNKRVIGMASAEIIPHAYLSYNALERSSKPQKAMAGIHQLWVHAKFRKQGIAQRLVDAVRFKLVFGLTVPKELLAFSSPTEAGSSFARKYVHGEDSANDDKKAILVYDCC